MEQFLCGLLTSAFIHYYLDGDPNAAYNEKAACEAQEQITWKEEQKGGVIIVHEIGRRTTKRVEDEVEKAKNASIEAEIAAEKKAKAEIDARKKTKKA